MEKLIIDTHLKTMKLVGFDDDNELEILIWDEIIWLQKDQVKQIIQFLQNEVEKLEKTEN